MSIQSIGTNQFFTKKNVINTNKKTEGNCRNWETEKGGRTEEKRMRENKIRRKGRQKKQRRRNGDGRNRMR